MLSLSFLDVEFVADPAYGMNEAGLRRIAFDLLAKVADMHHQRARVADAVGAPDDLIQGIELERLIRMLGEIGEQIEFLHRQVDKASVALDRPCRRIDDKAGIGDDVRNGVSASHRLQRASAELRMDAGDELPGTERLGHIIIAAEFQSVYNVVIIVLAADE